MKADGYNSEILNYRLPRWEDLSEVDLYLTQLTELMEKWLGPYLSVNGEAFLTKTMINNYVKDKILLPPVNKKYNRLAQASVVVICLLKSVYNIREIDYLIKTTLDYKDPKTSYNRFCDAVEQAIFSAFTGEHKEAVIDLSEQRYIMQNAAGAFACKLYVQTVCGELSEGKNGKRRK